MAGLSAGDLDRDINIQIAEQVQTDSGETSYDWANASSETVAAQWLPAGTTEAWKAQQRLEGVIEGIFRMQWRDDIDPASTRIVWDGKIFDVRPPIEGGRQDWLDVPVTATDTVLT